jgi:hypothetical protein
MVEVDDGRGISKPIEGSEGFSSSDDAVLNAGRSRTWRMDGLRNESKATGRGRIVVARVEVVMVNDGTEKRRGCVSLKLMCKNEGGVEKLLVGTSSW